VIAPRAAMSAPAKKARRGYKLTPCGEIPRDWECVTLGSIFAERIETGFTDLPLLAVTGERGIVLRDSLERRDSSSEDKSAYLRVCPGDIAYNTMRMWQGVSGLSPYEGIVSPAYTVCRPLKGLVPAFAPYLLKHPANIRLFHRHSQGLVDDTLNLKFPHFARLHVALPTESEQSRIAEILADVSSAISATTLSIESHRAVRDQSILARFRKLRTRSFKLEEVILSIDAGKSPVCEERPARDNEAGVLKVGAVSPGGFLSVENKVISNESIFSPEMRVAAGDLLMIRGNGSKELVGLACIATEHPQRLYLSDLIMRVRLQEARAFPPFVASVLRSRIGREQIEADAVGSNGIKKINRSQIRALTIPIPPLDEQRRIVEHLDHWTAAIAAEGRKLAALERVKAELARRLLTGELRVKL
jgi:type I restriction enzyme S subunit